MIIGSEELELMLKPQSVENLVSKFVQPKMSMLNIFSKQNNEGDKHFEYALSKRTADTDIASGILPEPVELTEGSEFPQVAFTGIQEEYGNMTRFGFEVEFTKEARKPKNYAFFQDCIRDMGYTMMRMINRFAYYELIASAGLVNPIELGDGAWTKGNEAIDDDLTALKRAMKNQENYKGKYNMSDIYISQTAYDSAEDLYKVINPTGVFTGNQQATNFNQTEEFESGLLGLDLRARPAIWYYNIDEEDNRLNDPKVPNSSIINVNYFEDGANDKHPKTWGYQLYVELGLAVNKEMAVLYQEGV